MKIGGFNAKKRSIGEKQIHSRIKFALGLLGRYLIHIYRNNLKLLKSILQCNHATVTLPLPLFLSYLHIRNVLSVSLDVLEAKILGTFARMHAQGHGLNPSLVACMPFEILAVFAFSACKCGRIAKKK